MNLRDDKNRRNGSRMIKVNASEACRPPKYPFPFPIQKKNDTSSFILTTIKLLPIPISQFPSKGSCFRRVTSTHLIYEVLTERDTRRKIGNSYIVDFIFCGKVQLYFLSFPQIEKHEYDRHSKNPIRIFK